ncbi:unnamed protein product [Absidia cylindrospora]
MTSKGGIPKSISLGDSIISFSGLDMTLTGAMDHAETLEQLDKYIRKKDGEIERMCNSIIKNLFMPLTSYSKYDKDYHFEGQDYRRE